MLSDSTTGKSLLSDSDAYYSNTIEGDYRSVGGADSVSPFSQKPTLKTLVTDWISLGYKAGTKSTKITLPTNLDSNNITVGFGATSFASVDKGTRFFPSFTNPNLDSYNRSTGETIISCYYNETYQLESTIKAKFMVSYVK